MLKVLILYKNNIMVDELLEIYNKVPEPFKSAVNSIYVSIDYKVVSDDHKWLEEHGYSLKMLSDCSYSVINSENGESLWFNASSYGNWGTCYKFFEDGMITEEFSLMLRMWNENVIDFWRIS